MGRIYDNLFTPFMEYASVTESPSIMHYWAFVGAIAGCLRRKVWLDMKRFQWTPSFFIIFVAPPGVVSKSTTADIAMDLLKKVPGIKFGPDVITWPALVGAFAAATESFQYKEDWVPMSPLTLLASELGNLINPQDREMINLYIQLWDGRKTLEKVTKMSGNDLVEGPWINLLGCTTPHWIADNMPTAVVGGGFTSRCIFIYADKKDKLVAYVDEAVKDGDEALRDTIIHDLEHIATNLCGPYALAPAARAWGHRWYENLWANRPQSLEDDRLDGYIARKQTHMHKLAMVIAASCRDDLIITEEDLVTANFMLEQTEKDLDKVFSRMGRSEDSIQAERFMLYVQRRGVCPYDEAYRYIQNHFPNHKDFEGMMDGMVRAGMIDMSANPTTMKVVLTYKGPPAVVPTHNGAIP